VSLIPWLDISQCFGSDQTTHTERHPAIQASQIGDPSSPDKPAAAMWSSGSIGLDASALFAVFAFDLIRMPGRSKAIPSSLHGLIRRVGLEALVGLRRCIPHDVTPS
jgi:hypothetical protein